VSDFFFPRFPRSRPRDAKGGIKAHSRRGAFGESWWARRWIAVLESFDLGGRLQRGRAYARRGQVVSIAVEEGQVGAHVQGSRPDPYEVRLKVKTLTAEKWSRLGATLAGEALFVAKLLASEMPPDIEEAFRAAGLSLFPERREDLQTSCSCPDWSNPCKHVAAVYYLLGEEFDRDPFLIFRLRGLDREGLVRLIGRVPARTRPDSGPASAAAPVASPQPLSADLDDFWKGGDLPEGVLGDAQPPPVSAALVRRLGRFPFWRGREPLLDAIVPVYEAASALGVEMFLGQTASSRKQGRT